MKTADAFVDSFKALLDEGGPALALQVVTGTFVNLLLAACEDAGEDSNKPMYIRGGEERDITVHAKKGRRAAERLLGKTVQTD